MVAQRYANEAVSRKPQRGKTPEIWRSEPLNQRNPARTASNQIARGRNAAFLTVFPQTPRNARLLILNSYERQNCFKAWDRMIDKLHSKANPHFPIRPDHKQLTNLPAILHSRYPGIQGPVKDLQQSLKTMTAQTKSILRDRLWKPRH